MRLRRAAVLLTTVLVCACVSTRKPVTLPLLAPTGRLAPVGLSFDESARALVVPLNAYVRIQGEASKITVPYIGTYLSSQASDDIVTLDYTDSFRAAGARFLDEIFPNRVASRQDPFDVRAELKLARTTYDRTELKLRLYLTFRLLSPHGTVLYQTVATTERSGDVLDNPSLLNQALEEALRQLGATITVSVGKIREEILFAKTEFGVVQQILLRSSTALGRSDRQNSDVNGRQYAVIIGVADYEHERLDLKSAGTDARDVFEVLNDPANGFNFEAGNVVLLLDRDATLRNIRTALSRWLSRRVTPNDTVMIYFAGHGMYDIDLGKGQGKKEKYFLPTDFDPDDDTFSSGLPMDEITEYFEKIRVRNMLMIFDACHAGAADLEDRTDELRRFSGGRSERLNAILAAAKATQLSVEYNENGLFTGSLVRGLRGEADGNSDGTVTVAEIAAYVSRVVPGIAEREFGMQQEPVLKVNDRGGAARLSLASF